MRRGDLDCVDIRWMGLRWDVGCVGSVVVGGADSLKRDGGSERDVDARCAGVGCDVSKVYACNKKTTIMLLYEKYQLKS